MYTVQYYYKIIGNSDYKNKNYITETYFSHRRCRTGATRAPVGRAARK